MRKFTLVVAIALVGDWLYRQPIGYSIAIACTIIVIIIGQNKNTIE